MPLADGSLTPAEMQLAVTKLQELWTRIGGRPPCRSCGGTTWWMHPSLLENRSDAYAFGSPFTRMPTVAVYCKECGQVEHHVSWVLGIQPVQANSPPPMPPAPAVDPSRPYAGLFDTK